MGVADYGWIEDSGLGEAGCVTVVPGGDVDKVLAAFGAVPASARPATSFDDVDDLHGGSDDPICVVALPGAVVVIENNGYQGTRAEVLGPASRAGAAATASSFFWNVDAVTSFSAARRGEVLFSVELVGAEEDELDGVPKPLRRHVVSAGHLDGDLLPAGLDLVRRWTRTDFAAAAVATGTVYDTEPPASELRTWVREHSHVRDMAEAPALLASMSEAELRLVAAWSCAAAAREAGIADHEPVARALAELEGGGRGRESPPIEGLARAASSRYQLFDKLSVLLETGDEVHAHQFQQLLIDPYRGGRAILSPVEGRFLVQAVWAYDALRYSSHDDAFSAAAASLDAASTAFSAGRTDRGALFTEDERGRRHSGSTPNPRHEQFLRVATRFLSELGEDPVGAAERATADLPRPMAPQEKADAVRLDLEAASRGDFAEWQMGPPEWG